MKTHSAQRAEELDLAIPDMSTEEEVRRASAALTPLPGIVAVRIVERGAFVHYDASAISKEEINAVLHQAGFRSSTFQDSRSGKTGLSSQ